MGRSGAGAPALPTPTRHYAASLVTGKIIVCTVNPIILGVRVACRLWPQGRVHATFAPNITTFTLDGRGVDYVIHSVSLMLRVGVRRRVSVGRFNNSNIESNRRQGDPSATLAVLRSIISHAHKSRQASKF